MEKYILTAFWVMFAFILIALIIYRDGKSKSDYLRIVKHLDYPWYKATFLPPSIFGSDCTRCPYMEK